ncbi:MAG: hypothetical protein JXR83_07915 [Deltaproteobacteria bacterium]|nr:hypothetical protein [Deltaproteobacteria bacterium]
MTTRRRPRPAPQLELPLPRPPEVPGVPILIRGNRRPRDPIGPEQHPEQHLRPTSGRGRALDMLFGEGCDR